VKRRCRSLSLAFVTGASPAAPAISMPLPHRRPRRTSRCSGRHAAGQLAPAARAPAPTVCARSAAVTPGRVFRACDRVPQVALVALVMRGGNRVARVAPRGLHRALRFRVTTCCGAVSAAVYSRRFRSADGRPAGRNHRFHRARFFARPKRKAALCDGRFDRVFLCEFVWGRAACWRRRRGCASFAPAPGSGDFAIVWPVLAALFMFRSPSTSTTGWATSPAGPRAPVAVVFLLFQRLLAALSRHQLRTFCQKRYDEDALLLSTRRALDGARVSCISCSIVRGIELSIERKRCQRHELVQFIAATCFRY